ncbi:MAG: hypothetical protein JW739_05600 [Opitutales bacterium]|nr:hypothetical protein [Opitutales bacterium]
MSPTRQSILKTYRKNSTLTLSPLERILLAYNKGMQAAEKEDEIRLRRILEGLISALDFTQSPIVPTAFLRLYTHCLHILPEGRYKEIRRILLTLRTQFLRAAQ